MVKEIGVGESVQSNSHIRTNGILRVIASPVAINHEVHTRAVRKTIMKYIKLIAFFVQLRLPIKYCYCFLSLCFLSLCFLSLCSFTSIWGRVVRLFYRKVLEYDYNCCPERYPEHTYSKNTPSIHWGSFSR